MRLFGLTFLASLLTVQPAFAADGKTPVLEDPTTYAALGLILFLLLIWRLGVFQKIMSALDSRADGIAGELERARALREEAQDLLSEIERRQKQAESEVVSILDAAKKEAELVVIQLRTESRNRLERREKLAADRISRAEMEATRKIHENAANLVTQAAAAILADNITTASDNVLFDKALDEIKTAHFDTIKH